MNQREIRSVFRVLTNPTINYTFNVFVDLESKQNAHGSFRLKQKTPSGNRWRLCN